MFIMFQRDVVLDIYENCAGEKVREFEWLKHLRLTFD